MENEGWFDPWTLLMAFKRKAIQTGVEYIEGEVVGFEFEAQEDLMAAGVPQGTYEHPMAMHVKTPNGKTNRIEFAIGIIAAGAKSGELAKKLRIGTGKHFLQKTPLPVEPRLICLI